VVLSDAIEIATKWAFQTRGAATANDDQLSPREVLVRGTTRVNVSNQP